MGVGGGNRSSKSLIEALHKLSTFDANSLGPFIVIEARTISKLMQFTTDKAGGVIDSIGSAFDGLNPGIAFFPGVMLRAFCRDFKVQNKDTNILNGLIRGGWLRSAVFNSIDPGGGSSVLATIGTLGTSCGS